eukprot:TRINITY_DN22628_c0_g1_i1.p1 TRINITY_DN22628_c0_g1~~TRINITY_DN22628_c0_g1_i1.p1  ORF type:complete len:893 (-),score=217.01 TRINITY_DN22628_c0_g1_i1:100-2778(-)
MYQRQGPVRQKTSVGALLFGGGGGKTADDFEAIKLPPANIPAGGALDRKDTRQFLESAERLNFPEPLPWAKDPNVAEQRKPEDPNPEPFKVPPQQGPPGGQFEYGHAAAMIARMERCERRLELSEATGNTVHRLSMELQQLREGSISQARSYEQRVSALQSELEQRRREEANSKEQMKALQINFGDFARQAAGMHRAHHADRSDMEGQVGQALAIQKTSAEEWRAALRSKDAQLQVELERLSSSVEELNNKLVSTQAEIKVRLGTLEANAMAAGSLQQQNPVSASVDPSAYTSQAIEFLRQQIERLRQESAGSTAKLSELQARIDSEKGFHAAAQRENASRWESMNQAVASARQDLSQSLTKRLEVLEARLGVERSELRAKQAALREEVMNDGQSENQRLQEVVTKFRHELDGAERRIQLEASGLRDHVESRLAQVVNSHRVEEDTRKSTFTTMVKRVEAQVDRQAAAIQGLRQEFDVRTDELRQGVTNETSARLEAEQRLLSEVREAMKDAMMNESANLHQIVQKQADYAAAQMSEMQLVNADRADRLSRYVDSFLANAGIQKSSDSAEQREGKTVKVPVVDHISQEIVNDLKERLLAVRTSIENQATTFEHRLDNFSNEFRLKLRNASQQIETDVKAARREQDKAMAQIEGRIVSDQEELKKRFDAYANHFDSQISSVQAAILRPTAPLLPSSGGNSVQGSSAIPSAPTIGSRSEAPPSVKDRRAHGIVNSKASLVGDLRNAPVGGPSLAAAAKAAAGCLSREDQILKTNTANSSRNAPHVGLLLPGRSESLPADVTQGQQLQPADAMEVSELSEMHDPLQQVQEGVDAEVSAQVVAAELLASALQSSTPGEAEHQVPNVNANSKKDDSEEAYEVHPMDGYLSESPRYDD